MESRVSPRQNLERATFAIHSERQSGRLQKKEQIECHCRIDLNVLVGGGGRTGHWTAAAGQRMAAKFHLEVAAEDAEIAGPPASSWRVANLQPIVSLGVFGSAGLRAAAGEISRAEVLL